MENLDVARTLGEVADLLEIQGANPFRVRAYRNAVRTVESLTRPLTEMVEKGDDLTELQGVGKQVDAHIRELLQTGQLTVLDEITREIPRTLTQLVRLDGVGPKKARKLYEELGVESVEGLEAEIERGTVEALAGFGTKSVQKIAAAIEEYRHHRGRFLRAEAEDLIRGLLTWMERAPHVTQLEVAGSYRRRKETVGDIDLLARADEGRGEVVAHFTAFPSAVRVEAAGETKGNIVLPSGLSVDLRVIPSESYGAALHYFTGSREHNVRVRTMAVKAGLRVNEWGVFRLPADVDPETLGRTDGERIGGRTEEEVFGSLELPWIPPELREDRGEFDAAAADALPELVILDEIRGDLHMHTTWSDGTASVLEMAEACRDRGYGYMAITDHSKALTMVGGLTPERVRAQGEEIAEAQEEIGDAVRILRGQEVDILRDGSLDQPDDLLEELDLVVIAVHSFMDMEREAMTERVLRAMNHPQVDILAHPTGRLLNRRDAYPIEIEAVLEKAAERGIAIEINAHPRRLDVTDRVAARARELGVRIVIDSDAHAVRGLDVMRYGVDQARRAGLERGHVLNCGRREEVLGWLGRDRG
ncbi:MAG: DNA polymerase/3'-5' exonuclease PolX [Longimicrobiales bacterium]|nr:DNA polymerase/3'-5' exonuclease PolX [Longimicrobiales bacterium]